MDCGQSRGAIGRGQGDGAGGDDQRPSRPAVPDPDPAGGALSTGRNCGGSGSKHVGGYQCRTHGSEPDGMGQEGGLYEDRIASNSLCGTSIIRHCRSATGGDGGSSWAFGRRRAGGSGSSSRRCAASTHRNLTAALQSAIVGGLSHARHAWLTAAYSSSAAAPAAGGSSPPDAPTARTRRRRSTASAQEDPAPAPPQAAPAAAPTSKRRKSRTAAESTEADAAAAAPAPPPAAAAAAAESPAPAAAGGTLAAPAPASDPPSRRRGRPSAADIAARAAADAAVRAAANAAAASSPGPLAPPPPSAPPSPSPSSADPLPPSLPVAPSAQAASSAGTRAGSPGWTGDDRFLEIHDAAGMYTGVVAHVGGVEEWHRDYLREITGAPARGPDVPLPSLEQFQRQLQMEDLSRDLALADYQQEVQGLLSEQLVERALPARRLTAEWVPVLAQRIQEQIDRFLALEAPPKGKGAAASKSSEPKKRRTRQEAAQKRAANTVPLHRLTEVTDRPGRPAGHGSETTTAAAAAADGSAAAAEDEAAAAARAQKAETLESLASWVPWVLPLPPPLLARAVVSAILNGVITYDSASEVNELPPGMGLSITVVDTLGRRVAEILAYMRVCELVCEKRKLVQAASKEYVAEQTRIQIPSGAGGTADGGGDSSGKAPAAAQAAVAARAARADATASGGDGGGGGGQVADRSWGYDQKLEAAAARLREARFTLNGIQVAARLMMPTGMSNYVIKDGTTKAMILRADDTRVKAHLNGAEPLSRKMVTRLQPILDMAGRVEVWDQATRIKIGAGLLQVALSSLQVHNPETGQQEPAFRHTTRTAVPRGTAGFQTPGMVVAHPQVLRWLEGDEELRRLLQPQFMPMLVEPRPWSNVRAGAYLTTSVPAMKSRFSPMILARLRSAHEEGTMQGLYDGLTVLGNVPWRVNTRVMEVMQRVLDRGGGKLGLPPSDRKSLPSRFTAALNDHYRAILGDDTPDQCGTPYMRLQREGLRGGQLLVGGGAMSEAEEYAYQRACDGVRMMNRNESGQRCTALYRMEVSRQFAGLGYDKYGISHSTGMLPPLPLLSPDSSPQPIVFFQPHHIDFRGRAYPLHPFLSHLGDDGARGLLQFGVGRPLGERGMRWLLIQVANLWGRGVDKYPLDERVAWAETMLPYVRASAAGPLEEGGSWWQQGEKPWQLLGACFEVDAALRAEGGPAAYVSHQPVNQDGTCNGLQHYAALGRDRGGGAAVNLLPASRPQDVYQAVANAVAERVARDRLKGRSEAAKVHGSVDRKLVKQTVMTYVYGVTVVGAREQIENRLEERGWTNARERRKVATYVAKVVFDSMADVFGPATAVRSWLDACARHAVSAGQPVMWRSALGFPIEQPYRKLPSLFVSTGLQRFSLRDCSDEARAPLDSRRQRSGFPPNYIHSLDGAHMVMTAMGVRRAGGCFAAVHDSFWTHAAMVEDMNRIIRDTFIELHSRPLLHELRAELAANPLYKNATEPLPPVPPAGDLDLEVIRDSTYFFS